MTLDELADYANRKYHIAEEPKDMPGMTVFRHPKTGKWIAVLLREWNPETGTQIERCDLKCGQFNYYKYRLPFFSFPFRMQGQKWLGIRLDAGMAQPIVFTLFDKAMRDEDKRWNGDITKFPRTATIFSHSATDAPPQNADDPVPPSMELPPPTRLDNIPFASRSGTLTQSPDASAYRDTAIPPPSRPIPTIPAKILEMRRMCPVEPSIFQNKCAAFYKQAVFMESYEDDVPWDGELQHYFPCYACLGTNQLRGYFTWRTAVRHGTYKPTCVSFAYIYLYELLLQIGAESPEDSLQKMMAFRENYLDAGFGDDRMRNLLQNWMWEFAVIHHVMQNTLMQFYPASLKTLDGNLAILRDSTSHSDDEVFDALCAMSKHKLSTSSVLKADEAQGKHWFAEIWRYAMRCFPMRDENIFSYLFGEMTKTPWYPLANAVYYETRQLQNAECSVHPCRRYYCKNGKWHQETYANIEQTLYRLDQFLHACDRKLREYLKSGHPLKPKREEGWAEDLAEAVIALDRAAKAEAAKPKVHIDFAGLDQIRRDASETRDSLLTDEECDEASENTAIDAEAPSRMPSHADAQIEETRQNRNMDKEEIAPPQPSHATSALDSTHATILRMLCNGESVQSYLSSRHLMPSIVTDAINEALFDEIGDNVLECDGETIHLVEDYRTDVENLL